jgi:hypothetical protein
MLVFAACGKEDANKAAGPGSSSTTPPPPPAIVDAVVAAAPPDAAIGPALPSADRAYGDKSEWAMRWAVAMNQPQATSPASKDWPCAYMIEGKTNTFEYGGPATCFMPPERGLIGCPTRTFIDDASPELDTTEEYAYDPGGHLVAMRRANQMRTRQILLTWDGDRVVDMGSDSNDDGEPDEIYRYTHEQDTIRHDEQHADGTMETLGIYTVSDGRIVAKRRPASEIRYKMANGEDMVTKKPGNRIEYVWKDNRLLEARGFAEKAKKPAEVGTYKYDCPDPSAAP